MLSNEKRNVQRSTSVLTHIAKKNALIFLAFFGTLADAGNARQCYIRDAVL